MTPVRRSAVAAPLTRWFTVRWSALGWADLSLAAVSLALLAIHLRSGLRLSPDSHTYIGWAKVLRDDGFDVVQYLSHNAHVSSPFFYLLPVALIAALQQIFGAAWQTAFLTVNLGLMLAMIALFRKIALGLGVRPHICAGLFPVFLVSADMLTWPHFLLSDMLFAVLVLAAVGLALVDRLFSWGVAIVGGLVLLMILVARPSAPPAVAVIGGFMVLSGLNLKARPKYPANAMLAAVAGIITVVLLAAIGYGWLMQSVLLERIQSEPLAYLGQMVAKGMVVHDRPDTFVAVDGGVLDIARLYGWRLLAFFSPYASSYSLTHILGNSVVLGLPMAALVAVVCRQTQLTPRQWQAVALLLALSLGFAMFHAATLIDYDWRYRFPTVVPLLLFTAVIGEGVLRARSARRQDPAVVALAR